MSPKRILFVDDEPMVLGALRSVFRKERARWDMVFASGGTEALTAMREAPFDVVVSDMRMPGMDGAALLAMVKSEYPAAARIVLSGHAEREAVERTLPVAHQFLTKPCEASVLRSTIERTCDLQQWVDGGAVRAVAGALDKLPSIPRAYGALMEAASRPGADLDEVVDIVASDPAMSTKVLQLVNSAFFGSASRIVSIREAVGYLGLDLLKGLAVNVHIFGMASGETVEGLSLDEVQRNAIVTARLARRLVTDPDHRDEAFTAALVRDVGRVILAIAFPERVAAVRREARSSGRPLHVVEREEFSVTHAEVGAYLIGVWGLPSAIVETVAHHHRPGAISDGPLDVLAAVHAADVLVDEAEAGEEPVAGLDLAFLERAGVVAELERWRALAAEELGHAG